MRIGIIVIIIACLVGVVAYSLRAQMRMRREIEELRIQIKEMQKPIPPDLLDAHSPSPAPKLEKSCIEMEPFL